MVPRHSTSWADKVSCATAAAALSLAKSLNLNTLALFAANMSAPPEVVSAPPESDGSCNGRSTTVCALMGK